MTPDTLLLEAAIESLVADAMAETVKPLQERIEQLEQELALESVRYANLLEHVLYLERRQLAHIQRPPD